MSLSSESANNHSCSTRAIQKAKKLKIYLFNENITLKATPSVVSIQ